MDPNKGRIDVLLDTATVVDEPTSTMAIYEKYQRGATIETKHVTFKCPVEWTALLTRHGVNVSAVCRDAIERIYIELQSAEARNPSLRPTDRHDVAIKATKATKGKTRTVTKGRK